VSSEGGGYGEQIMAINAYEYKDRTGTQVNVQSTSGRYGVIIENMDGQSFRRRQLGLQTSIVTSVEPRLELADYELIGSKA
jgi:hypothetical protein